MAKWALSSILCPTGTGKASDPAAIQEQMMGFYQALCK